MFKRYEELIIALNKSDKEKLKRRTEKNFGIILLSVFLLSSTFFITIGIIEKPKWFISYLRNNDNYISSLKLSDEGISKKLSLEIKLKQPPKDKYNNNPYYNLSLQNPKISWNNFFKNPPVLKSAQVWIDKDKNEQENINEISICQVRTLTWKKISQTSQRASLICADKKIKLEFQRKIKLASWVATFITLGFLLPLLIIILILLILGFKLITACSKRNTKNTYKSDDNEKE